LQTREMVVRNRRRGTEYERVPGTHFFILTRSGRTLRHPYLPGRQFDGPANSQDEAIIIVRGYWKGGKKREGDGASYDGDMGLTMRETREEVRGGS